MPIKPRSQMPGSRHYPNPHVRGPVTTFNMAKSFRDCSIGLCGGMNINSHLSLDDAVGVVRKAYEKTPMKKPWKEESVRYKLGKLGFKNEDDQDL